MKKRASALMLALLLCLGLAVPGWAADVSELDTAAKQAYHTVLSSQISQYGVMPDDSSSAKGSGLEYAALEGMDGDGERLVYTDETTEEFRAEEKSEREATQAAFERAWKADSLHFSGGLGLWLHQQEAAQAIRQLQAEPAVGSDPAPASGAYGPYTVVDRAGNVIAFDAARAQDAAVQIRTRTVLIGGDIDIGPYQRQTVVQVTLQPGSRVTFSAAAAPESGLDVGYPLQPNGNGRFTHHYEDTTQYWLDEDSLNEYLRENAVLIEGGDINYLVAYEDVLNPDISFTDVSDSAYYVDAVKWAVMNDITNGTTPTTFSPNNTCTVAHITTFLYRANGSPTAYPGDFYDDVKHTDWYVDAANWAYAEGLSVGRFGGNDPCTRAMAVTYLWILAGRPEAAPSSFTDVPDGTFYTDAVAWAVQEGITSGTSASTFSPNNICTRGQIVTFLYRAMA